MIQCISEKIRLRMGNDSSKCNMHLQFNSNVIIKVLKNKTKKEKEGNKANVVQPKRAF